MRCDLFAQLPDEGFDIDGAPDGQQIELCRLAAKGSVNEKVLPLPGSLSTQIWPPWYSTISLQMGRPRPVPLGLSVRVSPTCLNFSKTFG